MKVISKSCNTPDSDHGDIEYVGDAGSNTLGGEDEGKASSNFSDTEVENAGHKVLRHKQVEEDSKIW